MEPTKEVEYQIDAFIDRMHHVSNDVRRQLIHNIILESRTIEKAPSKAFFNYFLNNITADEALDVLESDIIQHLSFIYNTNHSFFQLMKTEAGMTRLKWVFSTPSMKISYLKGLTDVPNFSFYREIRQIGTNLNDLFLNADKAFFVELIKNFPALILRRSSHDLFFKVVFISIKFELEDKLEKILAEYKALGMNLAYNWHVHTRIHPAECRKKLNFVLNSFLRNHEHIITFFT